MKEDESLKSFNKKMITLEIILGISSSIVFILSFLVANYCVTSLLWKIVLIVLGIIVFILGISICLVLDYKIGFYKCPNCGHVFVPSFIKIIFSCHFVGKRLLKCPNCNKKGLAYKILEK